MCTVSWLHRPDGLELLCNRDERLDRDPADPPSLQVAHGVRYLAPRDALAGGTWLAVNEFGLLLTLLNGDPEPDAVAALRASRGRIIPQLIHCASRAEALRAAFSLELQPYAAFTLAILEPGHPAAVIHWRGGRRSLIPNAEAAMPLVSSSFDPAAARRLRLTEFSARLRDAGGRLDSDLLLDFHRSHGLGQFACAPCMHREGSATVSFSRIEVSARCIHFYYSPSAPCDQRPGTTYALARAFPVQAAAQGMAS